jgi:hypothetical protein
VPQQYKVSLSPGVDGGVHVSWQGDKPWEQSLSNMLAPERLVYFIQGNTLVVKPSEGRGSSFSRASASSRKADMIPQDMISGNTNEEFIPAESAQPMAMPPMAMSAQPMTMSAQPMTIRRSNSAPVQESVPMSVVMNPGPMIANPVPKPTAMNSPALVQEAEMPPTPHPSWPLPAVAPFPPVQEMASPQPVQAPIQMTTRRASNPAPVQQSMPVPMATVLEPSWHAEKGQTLRSTLQDWSKAAHVQLYWSTDYDYKLNSDFAYGGDFEAAVSKLLDQFSNVKPQPYGQLHRNPESGGILVINTYGTYN